MNSLVGYGVSSESDSDGEEDVNNGGACSVKEVADDDEASGVKRSRNFLLEADSASSQSDSESDPESSSSPPPHPQTAPPPSSSSSVGRSHQSAHNKLPPPTLSACSSDSSVFANPFKAQADRKLSALQKHVPLTMQAMPSLIGGKRVCVLYRKNGRCRFGIKCKFAHDSDLQTTPGDAYRPAAESEETPGGEGDQESSSSGGGSLQETKEEESEEGQRAKKRRVGLSNTLIPPKRAMKQYAMHRDRERLNMS